MTRPSPLRYLVYLFDVFAFAVCCVGIVHIGTKPGLPLAYQTISDTVFCAQVKDPSLDQRIKAREAILAINGHRISRVDDVEFMFDRDTIGDHVTLTVLGSAGIRQEEFVLVRYYGVAYLVIVIFVSGLYFVVGILVFWRKPDDRAAWVFHLGSVGTAMMLSTTWGSCVDTPLALGVVLRVIFGVMYAFVPLFFFHFVRLFPRPHPLGNRILLPMLYAVAAILGLESGSTFITAWRADSIYLFHTHLAWFTATRWFMIVLVFSGLWWIQESYKLAGEEAERRKLRWVVWGLFIGFLPFVVLWVIPLMLLSYSLVPEEVMLFASGFIPLAFGASIVKYHIMDIDLILNRSVVYGTVMAIIAVVYVAIVGGTAALVSSLTVEESVLISTAAAIVVALLFEPARRVIQHAVDRRFFRVKYDFRTAERRFQEDVKGCVYADEVAHLLIERCGTLLAPDPMGFVLFADNEGPRIVDLRGREDLEQECIAEFMAQAGTANVLPLASPDWIETGTSFTPIDRRPSIDPDIVLIHTARGADERILGLLLLGRKRSGTRYSVEDVDLLESLLAQVGMEIERSLLKRQVIEKAEEAVRLGRLNAMKSDFVSYVSHDLRTPLTSIKMFAEMMHDRLPPGDKSSREYLTIIEGESDRLQRMVNTILDSARIDREEQHYALAPANLKSLVRATLKTLHYQIAKEGFRVELLYPTPVRRGHANDDAFRILADADAVKGALLNLFSNAMKYAMEDKRIQVEVRRDAQWVLCSIRDFGRGIPREAQDHLFEKFYRDPTLPARIQGVGLGLSVVKHVMDGHHGTIQVESDLGTGSTFTLRFPLDPAPRRPHQRTRPGNVAVTVHRTPSLRKDHHEHHTRRRR